MNVLSTGDTLNGRRTAMVANMEYFRGTCMKNETGEQLPWLTDEEFLQKYRVSRYTIALESIASVDTILLSARNDASICCSCIRKLRLLNLPQKG